MNVETNRRHQISSRTGSPCDLHTRVHLLLSRSHSVGSYFFGMLCTMINDMMSGKFRALSLALSVSLSLPLWPLIFSTFYREMHSKWFRTMAVRETEAGERQRGREGGEIGLVMSWSLWGKGVAVSHCCHCCCCCCCLLSFHFISFHFLFDSKPFWICFYICPVVVVVVVKVVSLAIHKRAAAPHELLQQMRVQQGGGGCCCYHIGCNVHCSHW